MKRFGVFSTTLCICLVAGTEIWAQPGGRAEALIIPDRPASLPAAAGSPGPATAESTEGEKPEEAEEAVVPAPAPVLDPQEIRLRLMDGNIISGKLSIKEITVDTEFGKLQVPIASIRSFTPGLDSYPKLGEQVNTLIENLGSDDYAQRENARKALSKMGLPIREELKRHLTDENAERVRHIQAILKEFDELMEAEDEAEEGMPTTMLRQDTIVTSAFTIVGNITPKKFEVASEYGPLTINLGQIRLAERGTEAKGDVRKSLTVEGTNLAQLSFKNSGIRLDKGDRVNVVAEGQIIMSPWGGNSISTPDGSPNYGWYQANEIYGGTLVAKIGDSGKVFKVGAKGDFEADRSGTLQFAIAMQHDYAQGNYQFPGSYKLKVRVQPKQ